MRRTETVRAYSYDEMKRWRRIYEKEGWRFLMFVYNPPESLAREARGRERYVYKEARGATYDVTFERDDPVTESEGGQLAMDIDAL